MYHLILYKSNYYSFYIALERIENNIFIKRIHPEWSVKSEKEEADKIFDRWFGSEKYINIITLNIHYKNSRLYEPIKILFSPFNDNDIRAMKYSGKDDYFKRETFNSLEELDLFLEVS